MKKILVLMLVFTVFTVVSCGDGGSSSSGGGSSEADTPKCGNGKIDDGEVCDGNVPCW